MTWSLFQEQQLGIGLATKSVVITRLVQFWTSPARAPIERATMTALWVAIFILPLLLGLLFGIPLADKKEISPFSPW